MDLKWSVPRYKDSVFPRLGGLHIARNFMKCIGDHMNGSGLHFKSISLKYRAWSTVITMYFWPSFSDMCMHRWTTVFRVSKSCAGARINGIYQIVVKSGSHLLKAWLKADHVCDFDTLNTVVQRCMHISEKLGKKYTVISVDQALYFKLMDLKWSVPRYKDSIWILLSVCSISTANSIETWSVFIAIISSYVSLSLSFKNSNNGGRKCICFSMYASVVFQIRPY
jgi:hypothetical protein